MKVPKGFTLLEVICAIFLLGLALVAVQWMVETGFKSGEVNEQRLIAYNLLERKMESLQVVSFPSLSNEVRAQISDFPDYDIEVGIADVNSNLKNIQVTIYWTNFFNQGLSETISTRRANY